MVERKRCGGKPKEAMTSERQAELLERAKVECTCHRGERVLFICKAAKGLLCRKQ